MDGDTGGIREAAGQGRWPPIDREAPEDAAVALFGMGCFWAPEGRFGVVEGVVRTCVGYGAGTTPRPSYADIGDHRELVQVAYDPARCSYEDLLAVFWAGHDPTRAPIKRRYYSALPVRGAEQEAAARASLARRRAELGVLATEVIPQAAFHPAEGYHQKYRLRQEPELMAAFRQIFGDDEEAFARSTAAARANGYVCGFGTREQLERERGRLGLPEEALERLHARAGRQARRHLP